jgi:hypothetical protein
MASYLELQGIGPPEGALHCLHRDCLADRGSPSQKEKGKGKGKKKEEKGRERKRKRESIFFQTSTKSFLAEIVSEAFTKKSERTSFITFWGIFRPGEFENTILARGSRRS